MLDGGEAWYDMEAVVTRKFSFSCLILGCSAASQVILIALKHFLHKEGMFADTPNKHSPKADKEWSTIFSVGYTVQRLTKEHASKLDAFGKIYGTFRR